MSGGVDSSVSAVLLTEQGYDVIGVTMKLFEGELEGSCCNLSSTCDAKRICDYLKIPHYTLNFKEEFQKHVIDDFICEYANCRTPNPCIECNKYLKFGAMYKKALELECDYVATGHYARIEYDEKYNRRVLKKAKAVGKDQSYVLYNTPSKLLDKILFPLGDFESKNEIREIARKYKLPVANKPDSEDICFIPTGDYKKFLENTSNIKSKDGNIVDAKGRILGKHTGLYKYTIGQRKGLGIQNAVPLFVIGFNKINNELIVGTEEELYVKNFEVTDVNFLTFDRLDKSLSVDIKTRYSAKAYSGKVEADNNKVKVMFDEPQKAITPGQSAVFYDGDVVIGGGKIV